MSLTTNLHRRSVPYLIYWIASTEIKTQVKKALHRLGWNPPKAIAIAEIEVPDSKIANQATAYAMELNTPSIFNHVLRTYYYGEMLAQTYGWKRDREAFYLAAILHDLGISKRFDSPDQAFELDGAQAARNFLLTNGQPDELADLVHEAIAFHTSIGVADKMSEPEIRLVHIGAGVDVIAYRAEDLHPESIKAVAQELPRLGFKEEVVRVLSQQAERKPHSPIAGLAALGFPQKIRDNPYFSE